MEIDVGSRIHRMTFYGENGELHNFEFIVVLRGLHSNQFYGIGLYPFPVISFISTTTFKCSYCLIISRPITPLQLGLEMTCFTFHQHNVTNSKQDLFLIHFRVISTL